MILKQGSCLPQSALPSASSLQWASPGSPPASVRGAPRDAVTFAVVPLLLMAVASSLRDAARAAARLDPVKVLRAE